MTRSSARPLLIAGLLMATLALPAAQSVAQDSGGIATYRNERHGFSLSYPAGQFIALPSATEDGRQFVSKDGSARLLVGTLPNFDNKNLRDYRTFVLNESYPGAKVDYAPLRDTVVRDFRHPQRHGVLSACQLHLRQPQHQQLGRGVSGRPESRLRADHRADPPRLPARQRQLQQRVTRTGAPLEVWVGRIVKERGCKQSLLNRDIPYSSPVIPVLVTGIQPSTSAGAS